MTRFPALGGLALFVAACGTVPSANVSRDWTETIGDLGLTAIYPMHEGVTVGDLWVAGTPLASGDQSVRTFGELPAPATRPEAVALPTVNLSADDAADLGLGGALARGLGLSGSRDDTVSVALTGVTSREIDDSTAWGLLASACNGSSGYLSTRVGAFDGSARSFGAYRNARSPGYLTVVTNVYLATGVNYQLSDKSGGSLDASVGGVGTPGGTAGSQARAAAALTGATATSTTRAGLDGSFSNTTGETLSQTFTTPLAFAYDGFTIRVDTPGTLCQAIRTGQTVAVGRTGVVRIQ